MKHKSRPNRADFAKHVRSHACVHTDASRYVFRYKRARVSPSFGLANHVLWRSYQLDGHILPQKLNEQNVCRFSSLCTYSDTSTTRRSLRSLHFKEAVCSLSKLEKASEARDEKLEKASTKNGKNGKNHNSLLAPLQ